MNGITLAIKKLRVFLSVNYYRDRQRLFELATKYLWLFLLCLIYAFFFKAALWQKMIKLGNYQIDFPFFLISGLAMARFVLSPLRVFDDTLKTLRGVKMMEWLLLTPSSPWELFTSQILWGSLLAFIELIFFLAFAKVLIGIPIKPFLQCGLWLPTVLAFLSYAGIGMITSGLILFLRRGSSLFAAIDQISIAFGGVFFSVALFPHQLQWAAYSLPVTHLLPIIRYILIHADTSSVSIHLLILALMALAFSVIGVILLETGLRWAKRNGHFSNELTL